MFCPIFYKLILNENYSLFELKQADLNQNQLDREAVVLKLEIWQSWKRAIS